MSEGPRNCPLPFEGADDVFVELRRWMTSRVDQQPASLDGAAGGLSIPSGSALLIARSGEPIGGLYEATHPNRMSPPFDQEHANARLARGGGAGGTVDSRRMSEVEHYPTTERRPREGLGFGNNSRLARGGLDDESDDDGERSDASSAASYSSLDGDQYDLSSKPSRPAPSDTTTDTRPTAIASRAHFHSSIFKPIPLAFPPRRTAPNPDPTTDDPLFWVLRAGADSGRNPAFNDLHTSHGHPRYILHRVPHTLFDEKTWTGLRVTGKLTRILHGTWYGRQAVWVGLVVTHSDGEVYQTQVTVDVACGGEVEAKDLPDYFEDPVPFQPHFVRAAPRRHYGSADAVERSDEAGLEGDVSAPTPGGKIGVKGSVKRTTNIALEKRQAITSTIPSPSCTSGDSAVSSETVRSLKAEQNEVTKDGVYEEMPMGMIIVTQGRPLVLSLQVEPKQKVKFRPPTAGSYRRSAPVIIDSKDWKGDGLPDHVPTALEDWAKAGVWAQLVRYPEDFTSVSSPWPGLLMRATC